MEVLRHMGWEYRIGVLVDNGYINVSKVYPNYTKAKQAAYAKSRRTRTEYVIITYYTSAKGIKISHLHIYVGILMKGGGESKVKQVR
jgi:hypothetical protein